MYLKQIKNLLLMAGLTTLTSTASALVIDFEGFAAGTIIDNEYQASHGATIRGVNTGYDSVANPGATNIGVVFDTGNPTGGDTDLGSPFSNPNGNLGNYDPGNVLIIHERPSECNNVMCIDPDDEGSRPAGFFEIIFSQDVLLSSLDFFDIEYREAHMPLFEIELFSDAGLTNQLNTNYNVPDTGGDNTWDRLFFNNETVRGLRVNLGGSGAIDNLTYYSVSEPSSLLLLALGLLGLARARKKS